ncbi:MAG: ATP synthase subunit I [Candidatus Aminicenantales bacterium]
MTPENLESAGPSVASFEVASLRRIPVEIIILAAVVAIGLFPIFDLSTALFFFGGALLSALSFLWMKSALTKILNRNKAEAVRSGLLLYALRFVLILGVFLLIILLYPNRILAFAAGFSMMLPVFIVEAVRAFAVMKQWKA